MDYVNYAAELMKKIVSIPSESQNEKAIAEFLFDLLNDIGMSAELQHVEGKSYNVVARLQGEGKGIGHRKLLLGGHIDTVKPDKAWTFDPLHVKEEEGRFYGLGCGDMKGGLASQIAVIKKWIDEGKSFDGEIELVGFCDEERHSIGAQEYVRRCRLNGEKPADFGIFAEPHFHNIVVGATGKILVKVDIEGSTCHAATPEMGINAVSSMAKFLAAVDEKYTALYQIGKAASHSVLKIESPWEGYSLSVPDRCSCLINKQLSVKEKAEDFIEDLKGIFQNTVCSGNIQISRQIPFYSSYIMDEDNNDFKKLCDVISGEEMEMPEFRINQSVSDGNVMFSELGIPVVLYGPHGVNFHKAGEYLEADTLAAYMNILEKFMNSFFK